MLRQSYNIEIFWKKSIFSGYLIIWNYTKFEILQRPNKNQNIQKLKFFVKISHILAIGVQKLWKIQVIKCDLKNTLPKKVCEDYQNLN